MIGNSPYDRDELLVTGIPPAAEPLARPPAAHRPRPAADTRPLSQIPPARAARTEAPTETAPAETAPAETAPMEAAPLEAAPVFVDASGWRARLGRRLGLLAGALLVVFLGALGLGMTTGTSVPLTPWSEPSARPHVKVTPPHVTPSRKAESSSAARPGSTGPAGTPAPSTAPRSSSAPSAARPAPTAVTSTHPGKSQAEPPAWGRGNKKTP